MNYIGKRIYYCLITGEIISIIGDRFGDVRVTTVEEDISIFKNLSDRNRDSFDYIELEYGELDEDFNSCSSYKIDLTTKKIIFNYDNEEVEEVQVFRQPLSEKVDNIEQENADLLLDSVMKDIRIEQNETDIADLLLVVGGM